MVVLEGFSSFRVASLFSGVVLFSGRQPCPGDVVTTRRSSFAFSERELIGKCSINWKMPNECGFIYSRVECQHVLR